MTFAEFQSFVAKNAEKFDGVHPHTWSELDGYEKQLGHPLPKSMRWLLCTHGYSESCGIDDLEASVEQTLECRSSIGLPRHWLLLNDWGDAGLVLVDLQTGRICWCGSHNAGNLATGTIDADAEWFDGYPEWVVSRTEMTD